MENSLVQMTWSMRKEEEEIFWALAESQGYPMSFYSEPAFEYTEGSVYVNEDMLGKAREVLFSAIAEAQEKGDLFSLERDYREVRLCEEDWLNSWKKFFTPIPIGEKLEIVPAWLSPSGQRIPLYLEPKMGFGTGQHESTFLCLQALEREKLDGLSLLDIGAGSGILGVASVLLGAKEAFLLEFDELAIPSCEDTVERNHVGDRVSIYKENVFRFSPQVLPHRCQLALINIVAEVIVDILELPWISLIPTLYLSGILKERRSLVIRALEHHGWRILQEEEKGAWLFFKVQKF